MKKEDLRETISNINIPREMEQRIVNNCRIKKKVTKIYPSKSSYITVACILVFVMILGIPHLTKNSSGNIELVIGNSPQVIKAYAETIDGDIIFEEMILGKMMMNGYSIAMSVVPGLPFNLSHPNTTIEVTVDNGEFISWTDGLIERKGQNYTVEGEGTIYWRPFTQNEGPLDLVDAAIMEFRIIENGYTVGLGLVRIKSETEHHFYTTELLLSMGFPKVNGQYQDVTEKDIQKLKDNVLK